MSPVYLSDRAFDRALHLNIECIKLLKHERNSSERMRRLYEMLREQNQLLQNCQR